MPAAELTGVIKETLHRSGAAAAHLSGLAHARRSTQPGDAELDCVSGVLTGGKNSRLYKRLVYDLQLAQDVDGHAELVAATARST